MCISKIEHAALILRWPDYIYILLVVFLDRVFQQERFNRLLGFLASLIKMWNLLFSCMFEISAYRCWSNLTLKCYANTLKSLLTNREGVQALPLFVRQFSQKHVLA